DGDEVAAEERRRGAGTLVDLPDLACAAPVVGRSPRDFWRAVAGRAEHVHRVVADDGDTVLADRVGVLDLLTAQIPDPHVPRARVQRADAAVAGDPPQQTVPIGQHAGDR